MHYVGEQDGGIVIVSMEDDKNRKFQRAIIRTAKEDTRLLVTTMSVGKRIKALCNQCPDLHQVRFILYYGSF